VGGGCGCFGALIGWIDYAPADSDYLYWDTETAGPKPGAAGLGYVPGAIGLTTAELQADLPPGFDPDVWAITPGQSYPYLREPTIDLRSPLSTVVQPSGDLAAVGRDVTASASTPTARVYVFLPISQHDASQYKKKPNNTNITAAAAVYTMIARAIGLTKGVAELNGVKIDRYFWDSDTKTAAWRGPVRQHARLGRLNTLGTNTLLDEQRITRALRNRKLVILRATNAAGTVTHWLLATLYTSNRKGSLVRIIAHDPWTGRQIEINPLTKKITAPRPVPVRIKRVIIDGYQVVTLK
jgi:hypothetical protein